MESKEAVLGDVTKVEKTTETHIATKSGTFDLHHGPVKCKNVET